MFYELLVVGDDVQCGLVGWTVTTSVTSPSSLHPNPSHAELLQQLPFRVKQEAANNFAAGGSWMGGQEIGFID